MTARRLTPWQRIVSALRRPSDKPRGFTFNTRLEADLQTLASLEGCSERDLAAELLATALDQRYAAYRAIENWNELTLREQQITALYCLGYSTQEVADRLVISLNTVKSHMSRILHKFGVHDRASLLRLLGSWDFSHWTQ